MQTRGYRADIDGLRGIAILAVLLFHFRIPGISGGFVGVDVFFVISGFLITRNILADIDAGTWSYGRFYLRRARRLFPALFATLAATFAAAAWLLPPNDLSWLAETAIHSAVSTSNFLYWLELGYFGPAAERTPLLHTWSLSVEEQFYLLWPALMLAFLGSRLHWPGGGVRWLLAVLALLSVASIAAGEALLGRDPQAAFYLMPLRLAEFAAGAVLVWLPRLPDGRRWLEDLLFALGLGLVAGAVLWFGHDTPFPGVHALVPVLGAALLIYAGRAPRLGPVLANPPLVWLGLVSYSLYLVHWPLMVLAEQALMRPLAGAEIVVALGAAVLIAWGMTRWIERPIREAPRRPAHLSPAAFGLACAGLTVGLLWTATTAISSGGWTWRAAPEVRAALASLSGARAAREAAIRAGSCHMNMWVSHTADGGRVDADCLRLDPERPNFLVLGDSHAADRFLGLSARFPGANFLQLTTAACRPLLGNPSPDYGCRERLDYAFQHFLPATRLDGVILSGRWRGQDLPALERTLEHLGGLGMRIIVLGPAVEFEPWVADLVFRHGRREGLEDFVGRFRTPGAREMEARVRAAAEGAGAEFKSSIDAFCPADRCPVLGADGQLLIVDTAHQSLEGARLQADGYARLGLRLDALQ